MVLCCCEDTTDSGIRLPSVTVKGSDAKNIEELENLPLGIRLTGGVQLREKGLTGQGVRIGVIDSGVDKDHPGFDGAVKKQTWFRDGTSLSQDDHGTHVAGTIHLMAPKADIFDYRVFGKCGKKQVIEAVVAAIRAAVEDGCHVINMSLGGPEPSPDIKLAVQDAIAKGVHVICAAGNEGDNNPLTNENSWPANFPECISVAAVGKKKGLPVAVFSNSNAEVDYAGIGVDVVSFKPGGGYQEMSGTSMASPHVAGFVAALLTGGTSQTSAELRESLTNQYALDIGVEGTDKMTGVGFVTTLKREELDVMLLDGSPAKVH